MSEKQEIIWNVVNSLIAGGLVFVGAISDGHISGQTLLISATVAVGVALTLFKEYWMTQKKEYTGMPLFKFL